MDGEVDFFSGPVLSVSLVLDIPLLEVGLVLAGSETDYS